MLKVGKLDNDLLKELVFDKITYRNDDILVRPGIGEDCAVADFGRYECIMSTDPITAAVGDIGRLAVHITCNDIASNGVRPLAIMLSVMLPEGITREEIGFIMGQAAETAADLEVEIVGGHTEVTAAVKKPVIVSTAIGKALSGSSQSGKDMEVGDCILMTKWAGLEGTGIIARDYGERLKDILDEEELKRAGNFLELVSVVTEGVAAGRVGTHGMHDITEGGVLGAVWEMCRVSGKGARIWEGSIPLKPETKKICKAFDLNPLRLISSGSMLIVVSRHKKDEMERALREAEIPFSIIGRIEEESHGIMLMTRSGSEEVEPPASDEIYKVVE